MDGSNDNLKVGELARAAGLSIRAVRYYDQGGCQHGEVQAGDMPYGYREYSARDPQGGLWSFMKPLD